LERLIRYTARGAVSLERLEQDANGDLVYTFTHPWSDGTTGIRRSPVELLEKLAALVPLPRVHLVRYGGCLASHSHLRGAIIPTPRQQGIDEEATDTGSPRWTWARLLKRVFALDMARCPWCQRGALRIITAITHGEVIRKILQHLKLSADPPPIALAYGPILPRGPANEALQGQAVLSKAIRDRFDIFAFHIREQATDRGMGMLLEFLAAEGLNEGRHKGGQTRQHLVEELGGNLTFRQQLLLASGVSRFHPYAPSMHR
jgi:hypothetical protein